MNSDKKIGIWMDHSNANLIELNTADANRSIHSKFSSIVKEDARRKGEKQLHTKEQQMHEAYYKEIADEILKYNHVLLFGPTDAKLELYNYLAKDLHFKHVKIDIESADKMTDPQKEAFVKKHFVQ